jgi:maleate isomerase
MAASALQLRPEPLRPTTRRLLGMLTPSSNTRLEPITTAMLSGVPEASAHFGRFRVTQIALSDAANSQFVDTEILRAAELLTDARVHAIGWSGTSASWLGFESDENLCRRIAEATGVPACTSVLALNEIFRLAGVKRFGLVTPYTDDVQARIVANYARAGFECAAERHLGWKDNWSFSEVTPEEIALMAREVAAARPDAITVLCTGVQGAPYAEALERELGIPIYDSIATVVWKSLKLAGIDPKRVTGWGRLFREVA